MKIKRICVAIIFGLLSLMVLVGCQMEAPIPTPMPSASPAVDSAPVPMPVKSAAGEDIYTVDSVDGFIAAIGSDRVIMLKEGCYDLTAAADYGEGSGEHWYWQEAYDGHELVICGVENLRITGSEEKTELITQPRYADVLSFENSRGITVQKLTLGHSPEPGLCAGGVIYLDGCEDVRVEESYLYGCGIIGLQAQNSRRIHVLNSHIYDCSLNAVSLRACSDVLLEECKIHNNGSDFYGGLFQVDNSRGFALLNCDIYENEASCLLGSSYSQQVNILGSEVRDNIFTECMFSAVGYSPVVDKCRFDANGQPLLYAELPALGIDGDELSTAQIADMQREKAVYSGPETAETVELDESRSAEGLREVRVETVDEFLAAIGSNTVIKLDAELFDLSRASDYGAYGTDYYYWVDDFDGPGLVINGVQNLSIVAESPCEIVAIPRYADVLSFVNCEGISLSGFTAGHSEEPGYCSGGVLDFENCWGVEIDDCRLYGCGILGIRADCCSELTVTNTEIYDCSIGAIALFTVMDASFDDMDIHDCPSPNVSLTDCMDVYFGGRQLSSGDHHINS